MNLCIAVIGANKAAAGIMTIKNIIDGSQTT